MHLKLIKEYKQTRMLMWACVCVCVCVRECDNAMFTLV